MKVLVMGAGAVGGFYGAALAERGHDVTFVARGAHLDALRARGLTIRSGGRATVIQPVRAVADPAEAGRGVELVLFTVKGYDTEPAARALGPVVDERTAVLTLQNGVESEGRLGAVLGAERVLLGTTTISTTVSEPGIIDQANPLRAHRAGRAVGRDHPARGGHRRRPSRRGRGDPDLDRRPTGRLGQVRPARAGGDPDERVPGDHRRGPQCSGGHRPCYRALIGETVAVGRAAGAAFPADAVEAAIAFIATLPAGMKTSMQLDYERRRRVELEDITGAVVRLGRRLGVPTPTYDVVYAVLKVRATAFGGLG